MIKKQGEEASDDPLQRLEYETPARQGCDIPPMVNAVVNVVLWGGLALILILILFFVAALLPWRGS